MGTVCFFNTPGIADPRPRFRRWVAFMSGLARITLPDDAGGEAYVGGGEFGLILAVDTANVSARGHRTVYPGLTETVALEMPTRHGRIPPHEVLYSGPCKAPETRAIRAAA